MSKKNKSKPGFQQRFPKWRLFALGIIAVIGIAVGLTVGLWPSNAATTAQEGDTVKVSYTGTADDGWIFNSAGTKNGSAPKQLTIGRSISMPPGFMKGIVGMSVNETKTFRVAPDEGYGPVEIHEDISLFPPDANVSIGKPFSITTPNGLYMEARVTAINGSTVILENIDPLAGQYLNYEVTLVELIKAQQPSGNTSSNMSSNTSSNISSHTNSNSSSNTSN
jgi:FKBP-type peptidyl-prolyl cis-trans isomerase 2